MGVVVSSSSLINVFSFKWVFDIDINLKWFRGISKPKKVYDYCWQQNMLSWVLL